ncbi:MAG: peptide chain release factor N(5)-glutamine methyltransferase, partial [Actinomycetaceae bacterium]|nr:peptide chain release factor N(5)-glutamine methyltransferase [Actinomycetaceae bacterium]
VDALSQELIEQFVGYIDRRCKREPLQHITGTMNFRFLELDAASGTFIVRPETEWLVDDVIVEARRVGEGVRVVDLCTGSGAIALSLATEIPTSEVWAVELSDAAFACATRNNERYGNRVSLVRDDALNCLPSRAGYFDVVVSNPPYVPANSEISPEVAYDPSMALWGGENDGLDVPYGIIDRGAYLLREGGLLVMEHDSSQSAVLREKARAVGFDDVATKCDATGRERWLWARKSSKVSTASAVERVQGCEVAEETVPSSTILTVDSPVKRAVAIARACRTIRSGELVVLPTDTVYGVGADPRSSEAVSRLFNAKGRTRAKPSPVLVASIADAQSIAHCDERALVLADAFFPGALTLVLPARSELGWDLGESGGTIAVRMPAHDFTLELLAATGPLAVSSANLSDQPPARRIGQACDMLGDAVSLYLDAGSCPDNAEPSTIVSLVGEPRILREGSISTSDIAEIIGEVIPCASIS